jgi:hypothetical protein
VAAIYVYAVARHGTVDTSGLDGVDGAAVGAIGHGGLDALVSEVADGRLHVRRRDLVRHLELLEAAFVQATIVPCAFGTVLADEAAVRRDLLERRRPELERLLERLDGRLQLNVRAVYDEEAVLREIVASDPEIARLRRESRALGRAGHFTRIRLGELVAGALGARRVVDERRLLDRLAARADDVVVETAPDTVALKASFLVARKRVRRFDAALEELAAAESPRLSFESVGPLPPTAFAGLASA